MGMSKSVNDVHADIFIREYARHLQKQGKVKGPIFFELAKTASAREAAPYETKWWFTRIASIARKIYLKQGIGVGYLREVFGGSHRRGSKPAKHSRAAGNIIRKCLQQLEQLGIIEKVQAGGRKMTETGRQDLDLIAGRC